MVTRIDRTVLQVLADGVDISDQVVSLRLKFGFDLKTSEAELSLRSWPASVDYWKPLVVSCGLQQVDDSTHGLQERFNGYCYDLEGEHWPYGVKLIGRGPLVLAERTVVPEDEEAELAGLPLAAEYEAPGIDLSCNPDTLADWSDADMATWVLGRCGLTARCDGIGGVGRLLGTYAFDQFVWRRGQSALDFLGQLDQVCVGMRTFEALRGRIWRRVVSPRTPFVDDRIELQEGRDILEGARLSRSAKAARNRAVVQGYDDGGGALVAVKSGPHPAPPPGLAVETVTLNSPLIEKELSADSGDGLSCEEVAQWLLDEHSSVMLEASVPTWKDDTFEPGRTAYLNAPHLLGVNQSLWIKSVQIEVAEDGAFTQTLELRGPLYDATRQAPVLGTMTLANALEVNSGH